MPPDPTAPRPILRRLWPFERGRVRAHLLRLDPEGRRMRFAGTVGDDAVRAYADRLFRADTAIFGAFVGGELRAVAELNGLVSGAEFAISVERDWQGRGIGDALVSHLLIAARNRGIRVLHMTCLGENARMRRLAARHGIRLVWSDDAFDGTFDTGWPTPFTIAREMCAEAFGAIRSASAWAMRMPPA